MSKKQKQPETRIMINDISQRGVTMWFRCGGIFDQYFAESVLKFLKSLNIWQRYGGNWLP